MPNIVSVNSLEDFVRVIEEINRGNNKKSLCENTLLFRGQTNIDYELIPSIARENKNGDPLIYLEQIMIAKAIGKRPDIFFEEEYAVNLLVKLQHFGLPTRLLDVTYNSLVALYFACGNPKEASGPDGAVYVFAPGNNPFNNIKFFYNRDIQIISQMYKMGALASTDILEYFDLINFDWEKTSYVSEYSKAIYADSSYYLENLIQNIRVPNFVSPVELSERQKRQQGAFIIFPNEIENVDVHPKEHPAALEEHNSLARISNRLVKLEKDDNSIISIIRIPYNVKQEILQSLKVFGITTEFLFPDSVDVICSSIKASAENQLLIAGQ